MTIDLRKDKDKFIQEASNLSESCLIFWDFLLKKPQELEILLYPFSRFLECIFYTVKVGLSFIPNAMTDQIIRNLIARDMKVIIINLIQRPLIWEYAVTKKKNASNLSFLQFITILPMKDQITILLKKYPVLNEILLNLLFNYLDFQHEFLCRLKNDLKEIEISFKHTNIKLINFEIKGDSHCLGRRTTQVDFAHFNNFFSIMYKPRSMALENTLQKYIKFINKFDEDLKWWNLKIIDKFEYGWEEYVGHKGIEPNLIPLFYFRLGFVLGIAYSLNGHDLHFDNLIAHGEYPQFIDWECLFSIPINQEQYKDALWPSIWDTSIIPSLRREDQKHYDFSALLFHDNQISPNIRIEIQNIGTDNPTAIRKKAVIRPSKNYLFLSKSEERISPLRYENDIIAGFSKYADIVIKNKQEICNFVLVNFSGLKKRVIFKPTFLYDKLMVESYHPRLLSNKKDYLNHLQQIKSIDESKMKEHVFDNEIIDILHGDIPYFFSTTDRNLLFDSRGNEIPYDFSQTGIERSVYKITSFTLADLKNQQSLISKVIKENYDE